MSTAAAVVRRKSKSEKRKEEKDDFERWKWVLRGKKYRENTKDELGFRFSFDLKEKCRVQYNFT
jgi:hypothetical protein